jgi:cytochrome c oxidase subunit IV
MAKNNHEKLHKEIAYKQDVKQQLVSFVLMIFLTLIAFYVVANGLMSGTGLVLFLLFLAVIQVVFQLYVFMHMAQKDHEYPTFFIYSGLLVGIITVVGLLTMQ